MNTVSIGRALVGAVLLAVVVAGIPSATHADNRPNSLHDGAWALQFGVGDNFRLTSYEGGYFSVKRHFSDKSALRAVVNGGFNNNDAESGYTNATTEYKSSADIWDAGFTVVYQRYLNPTADVAIQFGVGPSFAYEKRNTESTYTKIGTDSTSVASAERTTSNVGGVFVLGAEFFMIRTISLHAEYVGYLRYFSGKNVATKKSYYDVRTQNVDKSDGWAADSGNVRFGLSVYF